MPIRFQVDGDFYDHPKAIGMSDSATALWVRAGSYSAAKLSDGFVAEAALSLLSRCPAEAASELVERGLWRRVKGGYRFHQWDHRNLLRARVEADREADRERKRRGRKAAGQNEKPQVNGHVVHPDIQPDSERIPEGFHPLSVSVSVSESVSGSGREIASRPPPDRCPEHIDDPDPPPCHSCRAVRLDREAEEAKRARQLVEEAAIERSRLAQERADAARIAIDWCRQCDRYGYLPNGSVCPHDPGQEDRVRRGAAEVRAALNRTPREVPDAR